ncbi:DotA/TraY family protein [Facilibium subflavum]|uniref:DotA/TraY family protein n=1 Tax=Facilibium subflavum TaxID=2219058 RepID=UPI000E65922D|nr:DotA/TraY family protein [Facilibium subflavum]
MSNSLADLIAGSNNDAAMHVIKSILGFNLNGIVADGSSTVLAADIFKTFNAVMLTLALVLYGYIVFVGVINTAKDGEFLGREWNTHWSLMRMIVGPLMAVPAKTGYCLAQFLVFYVIAVGVGFANKIWHGALDSINDGKMPARIDMLEDPLKTTIANMVMLDFVSNQAKSMLQDKPQTLQKCVCKQNTISLGGSSINVSANPSCSADKDEFWIDPDNSSRSASVCTAQMGTDNQPLTEVENISGTAYNVQALSNLVKVTPALLGEKLPDDKQLSGNDFDPTHQSWKKYNIGVLWNALNNSGIVINPAGESGKSTLLIQGLDEVLNTIGLDPDFPFASSDDTSGQQGKTAKDKLAEFSKKYPNLVQYMSDTQFVAPDYYKIGFNGLSVTGDYTARFINQNNQSSSVIPFDGNYMEAMDNHNYAYVDNIISQTLKKLQPHGNIQDILDSEQACKLSARDAYESVISSGDDSAKAQQAAQKAYETCQSQKLSQSSWWSAGDLSLKIDQAMASTLKSVNDKIQSVQAALFALFPTDNETVKLSSLSLDLSYDQYIFSQNTFQPQKLTISQTGLSESYPNRINIGADSGFVVNAGDLQPANAYDLNSQLNNLLIKMLKDSTDQTLKDKANHARQLIALYVNDRLNSNYLYMVQLVVNIINTYLQKTNDNPVTQSDKVVTSINNFLSILAFLDKNGVDVIKRKQSDSMITSVTSPSQQLIETIFAKLNPNESGSWIQKLYGVTSMDVSGDDSGENQGKLDYGAQFSAIQRLQNLGVELINDMVNSAVQIFTNVQQRIAKIASDYKAKMEPLADTTTAFAAAGVAASIAGAAAGGFWAPGAAAVGTTLTEAAGVTYQVMASMFTAQAALEMAKVSTDLMWLPLALAVISAVFSIGVMYSIVLPMIPFVLFWTGKVAWLLLVIESMVAAPLMALGICYPEGHQVFGKAQPGIQMVLNLFFRPVLMIIGLLIGLSLTYIVITFSIQGFHMAGNALVGIMPVTSEYARGIVMLFLVFMFGSFMMLAFQKCFSLIYVLPDKVLQWIGGSQGQSNGEQEMQELKSGASQNASSASQAGGSAVSEGISAYKQQQQAEMDKTKATDEGMMSGAKDGGGAMAKGAQKGRKTYDKYKEAKKAQNKEKID